MRLEVSVSCSTVILLATCDHIPVLLVGTESTSMKWLGHPPGPTKSMGNTPGQSVGYLPRRRAPGGILDREVGARMMGAVLL